ncbi:TrlF family AAA-like ATPase [Alkalibacterium putridalgicola]|uniref:TrlF family AAA-like ATPase n=1 Tax=Alkalibacterium putridalgicola TaxID=426703 RepID=UPI0034CEF5EE
MVGNRWYKCDLHLHSTASECFRDQLVTGEQWVNECLDKGLDCVALTDHNTGKNIDEYKLIAEKAGLVFFPGVEITCGDQGTHLLVIFDTNASTSTVEDFLIRMDISRKDFAKSLACSPKSVVDVVEAATNEGAIVIPAHIDEYNGLSEIRNKWLDEVMESAEIQAVQVVQKEFYENRQNNLPTEEVKSLKKQVSEKYGNDIELSKIKGWYNGVKKAHKNDLGIVTFSDNPHKNGDSKHGLWGIGRRYTYIKMREEPNIHSLREAFLFKNIRVVSDFEEFKDNSKELVLNRLLIQNTELNDEELVIDFSNNLTTVIGGRGTGKSCITRFLLYVLGKEDELGPFSEISKEYKKFIQKDDGNTGVLKPETKIGLELSYLDEKYEISRSENSHEISIIKNNEKVPTEIERMNMISRKIDLYAQKQIYEISKNQDSIRDILDSYNIEDIKPVKERIRENKLSINKVMREINSISQDIADKKTLELNKEDVNQQLTKLSDNKYKEIIDNFRKQSKVYEIIKTDITKLDETIESISKNLIAPTFRNISDVDSELNTLQRDLKDTLDKRQEDLKNTVAEMKKDLEKYKKQLGKSTWVENFKTTKGRYNDLKEELTDEELRKVTDLDSLSKELSELDQKLNVINEKEDLLIRNREELSVLQNELDENYANLTFVRREFIDNIFSEMDGIIVNISPQRDFEAYILKVRDITNKQDTFEGEFNKISDLLYTNVITYKELYSEFENIFNDNPPEIISDTRLVNAFTKLRAEQLLELKTLVPSDVIGITLNVNGKRVKLTNASAGQRTSAILSMILAYGESPLIMDQPEDDLDSQLINTLIVNSLVTKKENRQIIIITHNPNIPVNGDSEWVVCMGDTKKITISSRGSVDNTTIKERICDVMEGGQDAFAKRARRYGFKETLSN